MQKKEVRNWLENEAAIKLEAKVGPRRIGEGLPNFILDPILL